MSGVPGVFDRDDLTMGLRELISALHATGEQSTVRIVGGAAISLAYNAERASTIDIDALLTPRDAVLTAAAAVADKHAWVANWLNDKAQMFFPDGFGQRSPDALTGPARAIVQIALDTRPRGHTAPEVPTLV